MNRSKWVVRPTSQADQDYVAILRWTSRTFGTRQARTYETTLLRALHALRSGPDIIGTRPRNDLGPGIRTLHVARGGRKGRHLIVFRVGGDQIIDVLRLLHDSMDVAAHLSP